MTRNLDINPEWDFIVGRFDASQSGGASLLLSPLNAAAPVGNAVARANAIQLARVQCAPEASGPWVVTLVPFGAGGNNGPDLSAPGAGGSTLGTAFRPQQLRDCAALIEWGGGRGGAQAFAWVDWPARGCQFTVWGSTVAVSLGGYFANEVNNYQDTAPANSIVAAQLARGRTHGMAYRTIRYGNIGAGGEATFAIPAFARRFQVELSDRNAALANLVVNVRRDANAGSLNLVDFTLGQVAPYWARWFDLPVAAGFLRFLNASAGAVEVNLLYELGLS